MKDPSPSPAVVNPVSKESMREMKCEQSVLSRSDGSAIYSQGIYLVTNGGENDRDFFTR